MADAKKADTKRPPDGKTPSIPARKSTDVVVKKICVMPENLYEIAVAKVAEGLDKFNDLHQAADFVKTQFEADNFEDKKGERISTKGVWHCVIGRKFGSFVTFAEGNFVHFYIGQLCCLVWKSS